MLFSMAKPHRLTNTSLSRAHSTCYRYLDYRRCSINVSRRNREFFALRDHISFSLFCGPLIQFFIAELPLPLPSVLLYPGEPHMVWSVQSSWPLVLLVSHSESGKLRQTLSVSLSLTVFSHEKGWVTGIHPIFSPNYIDGEILMANHQYTFLSCREKPFEMRPKLYSPSCYLLPPRRVQCIFRWVWATFSAITFVINLTLVSNCVFFYYFFRLCCNLVLPSMDTLVYC